MNYHVFNVKPALRVLSLWLWSTETVRVSTAKRLLKEARLQATKRQLASPQKKGGEITEGSSIARNEATVGVSPAKGGETTEESSIASNERQLESPQHLALMSVNYLRSLGHIKRVYNCHRVSTTTISVVNMSIYVHRLCKHCSSRCAVGNLW